LNGHRQPAFPSVAGLYRSLAADATAVSKKYRRAQTQERLQLQAEPLMSKGARSPLADQSYKADPYAFYAQIRRDTPAYCTQLPNGVEVYLVTRYEDVQAGLKDGRPVKNMLKAHPPRLIDKLGFTQLMNNSSMLKADPPGDTRLRCWRTRPSRPVSCSSCAATSSGLPTR
jgi:hypothetical protein